MKLISVVGARPNFIKIAPFIKAINNHNKTSERKIGHTLVHTGQHYDERMSSSFFGDLNIPEADINLGIGSGSHAEQVGRTMIEFEKVLLELKPDWVIVVGDVNATLACSVTAKKLGIKVCHIEAGLRSNDWTMPEEINRLVTDRISDLLLTPDFISTSNLKKEGVPDNKIRFVGNIMIDTLDEFYGQSKNITIQELIQNNKIGEKVIDFKHGNYGVITLHRPSNVDDLVVLYQLIDFLINEVSTQYKLLWPVHPRTEKNLRQFGLWEKLGNAVNIILLNPIGYLEMVRLNSEASFVLTDSGGLQEESCVLGTPCITLRNTTERPVTLREYGGLSVLTGNDLNKIREEFHKIKDMVRRTYRPELWDGKTAERCLEAIINYEV